MTTCIALSRPPDRVSIDLAAMGRRIAELPPLPRALAEALRVVGHDELPTSACVEAVERDPVLAAHLLRLANSPFYGVPGRIASVADAVRLLGLRTVAGALAAISLRGTLQGLHCRDFSFESYWRHSLAAAIAARELAARRDCDRDQAFVAGLLHDVGKLMLARFQPELAGRALARAARDKLAPHVAERTELGLSHDAIGGEVARHWGLPEDIAQAIRLHHAPSIELAESGPLCTIVQVASAIAHQLDDDAFDAGREVQGWASAALDLDDQVLTQVAAQVAADVARLVDHI